MYLVALTGGIGSGKSTVAALFAKKNIPVFDADDAARAVVVPGSPLLKKIQEKFGGEILQSNGELNRRALREKIFSNEQDRVWLEKSLHPVIWQRLLTLAQQASSIYCILIIPLLFETKSSEKVDRILVVDVPESVQLERASQRDGANPSEIMKIISQQIPRQQRNAAAHDIINNERSITELEPQIEQLHQKYQQLANQKKRTHRD